MTCPNDGLELTSSIVDMVWTCERGCLISAYVLACHMNDEKPRGIFDMSPLERV